MSEYTTQVRYICESYVKDANKKTIDEITTECQPFIFNDFKLYNPDHKKELLQKVLQHYYMREIGVETVGLWKFYMNRKINEILPYYNDLYKSLDFEFNFLKPVNYDETFESEENRKDNATTSAKTDTNTQTDMKGETVNEQKNNSTAKTTSNGKNNDKEKGSGKNAFSDTPQGTLSDVEKGKYLTDFRKVDDEKSKETVSSASESTENNGNVTSRDYYKDRKDVTEGTSNASSSSENLGNKINKYLKHIEGKTDSQSWVSLIKEYQEKMINIDMLFVDEFKKLFMEVY